MGSWGKGDWIVKRRGPTKSEISSKLPSKVNCGLIMQGGLEIAEIAPQSSWSIVFLHNSVIG